MDGEPMATEGWPYLGDMTDECFFLSSNNKKHRQENEYQTKLTNNNHVTVPTWLIFWDNWAVRAYYLTVIWHAFQQEVIHCKCLLPREKAVFRKQVLGCFKTRKELKIWFFGPSSLVSILRCSKASTVCSYIGEARKTPPNAKVWDLGDVV